MVGTIKPKACATCRQRRIKCNKQTPCAQCLRAGWPCKPSGDKWDFRNEDPSTILKKKSAAAQPDKSLLRRDKPLRTGPNVKLLKGSSPSIKGDVELFIDPAKPLPPPLSTAEKLRGEFVSRLHSNSIRGRFGIIPLSPYLRFLPARVGQSPALDDAMRCLCLAPSGHSLPNDISADSLETRTQYVKALQSLQRSLDKHASATSTETLAAVMLLQTFELYSNDDGHAWVQHAKGAIRLLESRSPQQYKDELALSVLEAEIGNIITYCIKDGRRCFLADPEWDTVFEDLTKLGWKNSRQSLVGQVWRYRIFSKFPNLLNDFTMWKRLDQAIRYNPGASSKSREAAWSSSLDAICQSACEFRYHFRAWLSDVKSPGSGNDSPESDDSKESSDPYPPLPSPLQAANTCGAATFLIVTYYFVSEVRQSLARDEVSGADYTSERDNYQLSLSLLPDTDSLVQESIAYAAKAREVISSLSIDNPVAAKSVSRSMTEAWRRATALYSWKYSPANPVLGAVGSLWPPQGMQQATP